MVFDFGYKIQKTHHLGHGLIEYQFVTRGKLLASKEGKVKEIKLILTLKFTNYDDRNYCTG